MNNTPTASTFVLPQSAFKSPNMNPSLKVLGPRNFSLAPSIAYEPKKPKPKEEPEIKPPQPKGPYDHTKRSKKVKDSQAAKSVLRTLDSLHSSQVKIGEWQSIDVVTDLGQNNSQFDIKKSSSMFKGLGSRSKLSQYARSPQRASNLDLNLPLLEKSIPPKERSRAEN